MFETWIQNIRPRGWWLAAGAALMVAVGGGCGIIRHRTAARCEPGLPCYAGYGQKSIVAQTPGITFTGIRLIEQPVPEDVLARAAAAPAAARQQAAAERKSEITKIVKDTIQRLTSDSDVSLAVPAPEPAIDPTATTDSTVAATTEMNTATTQAVATPAPVRLRYFSLADTEMQVDHCTLSRVSLILWSDGRWELFVRAEQNRPEPPEGTPAGTAVAARPQRKQTSHIKRNEFHVVAKGFGASQAANTTPGTGVAMPVLLHRSMAPFWVERGQPREMTFEGKLDNAQDFDLIKRFEVEFGYR